MNLPGSPLNNDIIYTVIASGVGLTCYALYKFVSVISSKTNGDTTVDNTSTTNPDYAKLAEAFRKPAPFLDRVPTDTMSNSESGSTIRPNTPTAEANEASEAESIHETPTPLPTTNSIWTIIFNKFKYFLTSKPYLKLLNYLFGNNDNIDTDID